MGFIGIEPGTAIDASAMDTFNVSVWRTDATADLKIKLVDFAGGVWNQSTNVEHEINLAASGDSAVAAGQWVNLTLNLSDFTGLTRTDNIAQIIISSHKYDGNGDPVASGETLYIDNMYFGVAATPTPTAVTVSFDEGDTSGYTLGMPADIDYDFGGAGSSIAEAAPEGASGAVAQVVKSAGAQTWAGTTFLSLSAGELITATSETVTMRVWSPEAGTVVRLKLENASDNTKTVETDAETTEAGTWQTLTFNFANEATGTAAVNLSLIHI